MNMLRGFSATLSSAVLTFAAAYGQAESFVAVPLRVDPPQVVRAVALRAGANVYACQVRGGQLVVPADAPMPWTVAQLRFEPISYTARDLEMKTPLLLRELGELRVRFRPAPHPGEAVRGYVLENGQQSPAELSLRREADSFVVSLASGLYAAAFFAGAGGTRIRSGIVIAPGQATDIDELALEATGSVSLRVVDGKSKRPVQGARVTWSPPATLNSEVARHLFSRVWSGTTDRAGIVALRSIGPPPIPGRWAVQAGGYAATVTQQVLIKDSERTVLPDTPLQPESIVIVDLLLPRDAVEFRGASLVLSEPESDDSPRYEPILRQPLRDGENKVKLTRFGKVRFSIESKGGRKLLFHDVGISPEDRRVVLAPIAVEVIGIVKRRDLPVEGVLVTLADPRDARMIVGKSTTDRSGRYAISTYHSGEALIYTSGPYENAASSASFSRPGVLKTIRLAGERELRVDFQLPTSGATIRVVDAESRVPLHAFVQGTLMDAAGRGSSVFLETDDRGTARIDGAREGKGKVFVRSKGYRGREVTIDVDNDAPETTITLTKGGGVTGRVFDQTGSPVVGARILGGYPMPLAMQGHFQTATDSSGQFEIEGGPAPGTPFYVIASGHALTVTTLREDISNVVRLTPPNAGAVRVVAGQAPPRKLSLFLAAPRGGVIIPYGVFHEMGKANGLSPYQLNSSATDGTLILPEFLSPGNYTLYRVRPTGKPYAEEFDAVADLRVPATAGSIVAVPE